MKRELKITADGSSTLYIPEMDENYHSDYGALQEAMHVFIEIPLNQIKFPFLKWGLELV
jgi:tRNA U34 5-methylaminomethyl-2-thiouridine-forming methyltransferase MnmC